MQTEAKEGKKNLTDVPLHVCTCPPCFTGDGTTCTPKCDLSQCDEPTGICSGAAGSSGAGRACRAGPLTACLPCVWVPAVQARRQHTYPVSGRTIVCMQVPCKHVGQRL